MTEAFFTRDGDTFVPGDFCRGPWNRESLHGRVISGLLAREIERYADAEDWHIVRLTTDMFRLAPHAPVHVASTLVRDGNRIRSVEASMLVDGVEVAKSSALILRRTDHVATSMGEERRVALPHEITPEEPETDEASGDFRDGWEMRIAPPDARPISWMRMRAPFIEGEDTSRFVRAAASADFSSPASNRSEPRSAFINGDLTAHFHRYPEGEWIAFEPVFHESTDGVAVGACRLHDLEGLFGLGTVSQIANDRARARAATPTVR
ncbi:MAG: thioesterase family protein [Dehalococcoidia bacterium]